MKYLFVLTSSERDIFWEQTLAAIFSLRAHNPNAFVTLLTDDKTAATLTGAREYIKSQADEFKAVELDKNLSPMLRSRWLKTVMRNEIDGDFLYMDSDVAVTDDLTIPQEWRSASPAGRTSGGGSIYAVLDFHTNLSKAINRRKVLSAARQMNFSPIKNDEIFNGGVMFASDTPIVRDFFKKWHELWLYCVSKNYPYDMASLAETDFQFGYVIKKMAGEWNCQLAYGKRFLKTAKVIHFFGSRIIDTCGHSVPTSGDWFLPKILRKDFYTDIKKSGKIDEYSADVLKNAREYFLQQTEKVGSVFADVVRSYAFAKFLSFSYKKFPPLIKPLELAGKIL